MSDPAPDRSRLDPVVGEHLAQLQDRSRRFQIRRREMGRWEGHGPAHRLWNDYFALGTKQNLELMLRAMLTPVELDRLRTDAKFTEAWTIFVDFYWVRRLLTRTLLISLGCLAALLFVGWAGWAVYELVVWVLTPSGK